MNTLTIWIITYLLSAIIFAQSFKIANRNMKNANSLTILIELSSAFFALFFIPFFKLSFPTNPSIYLTLLLVTIIYAATDRLNIEARYGLDPSIFSMLKQLSTVFLIIFSFIFLKENPNTIKIIGAILIIFANFILTFEKGKIKLNKYFLISIMSNLLFAIAMLININIASNFNLAIYTVITLTIPALIIYIFSKNSIKKLKKEFKLYNKKYFLISGFTWTLMLISSVRAYEIGSVSLIAPLFALTSILNALYELIINKKKDKFITKIISAILIIIGVILIKK